jgi:hypothetical protein
VCFAHTKKSSRGTRRGLLAPKNISRPF